MLNAEENKNIVINGITVKPGEHKCVQVHVDRLPTGTMIEIPVFVFNGQEPGPTVLVQGGLHGDEINGVEIIRRMLFEKQLQVKRGCVIALPLLNIYGFIQFSRQVPDGKDVNRSFPGGKRGSLASRIAYFITHNIIPQIDFGIDLHTGGSQRHNHPQIRYTDAMPESKLLAEVFHAPYYFATALIKKSFRKAAFDRGVPIIVYEGGESMRFDEYAIREGIQGILNVLKHFTMIDKIDPLLIERSKSVHLLQRKWLRAPTAGMFVPKVLNGRKVNAGQILGIITDTYAQYCYEIKAPRDGCIICVNNQAVVNQGDALFHFGN